MKFDKEVIRGALLGCGSISQFHLTAWQKIKGVEIVALANRTRETALRRGEEFGIVAEHIYSDYRELIGKEDIHFVDIATAPHIHRMQVEDAAAAGLHVFCQKPFAPTLKDATSMLEKCRQANVLFAIHDNWRWRSWYRDLKSVIMQGQIGKPRYIRIAKHANVTLPLADGGLPALFTRQEYTREMPRLIVYEWGIHLIDVVRYLFGEVKSVYARMDKVSSLCVGEDRALIVMDVGGVDCTIDISWASVDSVASASKLEEVTVEGDCGTIELLPGNDLLRVTTLTGKWQKKAFDCTPDEAYQASYTAAQQHFIDCLREGLLPETVAADNIKTLMAAFAAYDSYNENRVVFLESVK